MGFPLEDSLCFSYRKSYFLLGSLIAKGFLYASPLPL